MRYIRHAFFGHGGWNDGSPPLIQNLAVYISVLYFLWWWSVGVSVVRRDGKIDGFSPFQPVAGPERSDYGWESHAQRHFSENIWRRNVIQNATYNSCSNILAVHGLFARHFLRYQSLWWPLSLIRRLLGISGLTHSCLEISLTVDVCTCETSENHFEIRHTLEKYLEGSF